MGHLAAEEQIETSPPAGVFSTLGLVSHRTSQARRPSLNRFKLVICLGTDEGAAPARYAATSGNGVRPSLRVSHPGSVTNSDIGFNDLAFVVGCPRGWISAMCI